MAVNVLIWLTRTDLFTIAFVLGGDGRIKCKHYK